jgi:hypothetical protein
VDISLADARDAYAELARRCSSADWPADPVGADLWIDGLDAVRSTPSDIFDSYLQAYCRYRDRARQADDVPELELFDDFLDACAQSSEQSCYHALCVGLALLAAAGGVPGVLEGSADAVIVNDSVMYLLSPRYRAIRVSGYHAGARCRIGLPASNEFRPAECYFSIPEYAVIDMTPLRVQQYNVNHDLAHLGAFADLYLHPVGDLAETTTALVTAEESCCALDLWTYAEASRFGVRLHLLDEMDRLQAGWSPEAPVRTLSFAVATPDRRRAYRNGLMSVADGYLADAPEAAGSRWGSPPDDIDTWIPRRAVQGHVAWCRETAALLTDPRFRFFATLIPVDEAAVHRLRIASEPGCTDVAAALFPSAPAPSRNLRAEALRSQRVRGLVHAAGRASTCLGDDAAAREVRESWQRLLRKPLTDPDQSTVEAARRAMSQSAADQLTPGLAAEVADALLPAP